METNSLEEGFMYAGKNFFLRNHWYPSQKNKSDHAILSNSCGMNNDPELLPSAKEEVSDTEENGNQLKLPKPVNIDPAMSDIIPMIKGHAKFLIHKLMIYCKEINPKDDTHNRTRSCASLLHSI